MPIRSTSGSTAIVLGLLGWALVVQCVSSGQETKTKAKSPAKSGSEATDGKTPFQPKTDAQWRKILTEQQYKVTRRKATERAFSGEYWNCKDEGIYRCICCGEPLFSSETKFESGTGWPSFWQPIDSGKIASEEDRSMGIQRIEVHCKQCKAHLGHVFDDGPAPTGLRYCINSVSLKLERAEPQKSKTSAKSGNRTAPKGK